MTSRKHDSAEFKQQALIRADEPGVSDARLDGALYRLLRLF